MDTIAKGNFDALMNEIAAFFGGKPNLAKALGIDRHALYQWKQIPPGRAYQIEVLSNGYFKAEEILSLQKDC